MPLCELIGPWVTPIVAGVFSLLGVGLGSYLNQRNTFALNQRQKRHELQHRSYAKLMGLKIPLIQALQTNCEAKTLCEYYEIRSRITGSASDLEEAKRQNDRGLGLIPRVAEFRQALSETLGDISVAYDTTPEIDALVEKLFRASSFEVPSPEPTVKTIPDLENWKDTNHARLKQLLRSEYSDNFDSLLKLLFSELRSSKKR